MSVPFPPTWESLRQPWVRRELLLTLEELSAPDPRPLWRKESAEGLVTGVDQVIHFLFDDHDFDADDIGVSLFDEAEVMAITQVKRPLGALVKKLPKGGDDDYARDPVWLDVTGAAQAALTRLRSAETSVG